MSATSEENHPRVVPCPHPELVGPWGWCGINAEKAVAAMPGLLAVWGEATDRESGLIFWRCWVVVEATGEQWEVTDGNDNKSHYVLMGDVDDAGYDAWELYPGCAGYRDPDLHPCQECGDPTRPGENCTNCGECVLTDDDGGVMSAASRMKRRTLGHPSSAGVGGSAAESVSGSSPPEMSDAQRASAHEKGVGEVLQGVLYRIGGDSPSRSMPDLLSDGKSQTTALIPEWLTVEQFATKRGVHHQTVRKAIKDGRLLAENWGSGGKPLYRIHREAVLLPVRSSGPPVIPALKSRRVSSGRFSSLVAPGGTPVTAPGAFS